MIRIAKTAGLLIAVLSSTILLPSAYSQRYLGSIEGEVADATGARIPGAEITVEETSTHFKSTSKSNDSGAYNFPALNPGTYTVTMTATGFKTQVRAGVLLTAGQLQKVDFAAAAGATSESVEVRADNALIDTGSPNIATTLSQQEVTDLPNNGRNPYVMATLAAGVINGGSGGYFQGKSSQFTNPFSGVAIQIISDGNAGHNRLLLDGIPNDPAERLSGASYTGFVPSPEAVQEVKVQTASFDAQVGHGNGTVTNTVVRNGTNQFHGAAYYIFQNTYLNANTSEKSLNKQARNNDQLSQTGAVFDGPVLIPKLYDGRNRTYFMVSFERYASHTAINYSARVPTNAERGGDFSALCSTFNASGLCTAGIQIYDPNSPVDSNGNRTAYFAGNIIPSGRISSSGQALMAYFPQPNVAGAAVTGTNYISSQTSYPSTYPSFIFRVDQSLGRKNKLNAIFFRSGLTQNYPMQGFPKGIGPGGYGYHVYRNNRGGSLDDVHQFSPSMVLDSRFGLVYHPFGLTYPGNQNFDLSSIGISSSGLPYTSFPGISPSGYASLAAGAGGQVSTFTLGSLAEILTKTIRTHTLRVGFEGQLVRYNVQNPQSGFGNFNFDNRFTQKNYNVGDATSGDPAAALLLGAFSSVSYNLTPAYALQQIYTAPFAQDDWRVTSRLTLNLGVRWDYETPFTERYNMQVSNFCTTCINPLQSSVSGLTLLGGLQFVGPNNRYPYPKDLNNWQPRLGVAYQASAQTVVRAGFGIIYLNTLESPIGTGFSQTTSYNNYTQATPLNPLSSPFPNGIVPVTGNSLGLSTAIGQGVSFYDPNHVQPKATQYTASVQQQFPGSLALQLAYIGARFSKLEVNHNINILPANVYNKGPAEIAYLNASVPNPLAGLIPQNSTLNAKTVQQNLLLLPFPEFGSVTENGSSIGVVNYNSLQIQVSRPMRHHVTFQANLTWDKVMLHNNYLDNYAAAIGQLESVEDNQPTIFGNVFGTVELPGLTSRSYPERLLLGGWKVNSVVRFSNGPLIPTPGNVDIIGDYRQGNANILREFNPCYQTSTIVNGNVVIANVNSKADPTNSFNLITACDSQSPNPAFRQRLQYTSQSNSIYLNAREPFRPLVDLSVFKQFQLHEHVSFEIRGEFFNVLNTPNWGGPSTTLGAANAASAGSSGSATYPHGIFTQANDPRIGQLTARLNF